MYKGGFLSLPSQIKFDLGLFNVLKSKILE